MKKPPQLTMDDPGYWDWIKARGDRIEEARRKRGPFEPTGKVGAKIEPFGYEAYIRSIEPGDDGRNHKYGLVFLMRNGREVAGLVYLLEVAPRVFDDPTGHALMEVTQRIESDDADDE